MGNSIVSGLQSKPKPKVLDPDTGKSSPSLVGEFDVMEAAAKVKQQSAIDLTKEHVVVAGDTLGELSEAYYGDAYSFGEIAAANGITDPNYGIKVGQKLKIPSLSSAGNEYRNSLHQYGRSEIGRLGNEALTAIRNFDYGSLYSSDFSPNLSAARELTAYHRRAALDANITYNSSNTSDNGYWVDLHTASLNGNEVFRHTSRQKIPTIEWQDTNPSLGRTLLENIGSGGTIFGSLGQGFGGGTFALGVNKANSILDRAGHLNAYQRGKLDGTRSLNAAAEVFSSKSQSGQALRAVVDSRAGTLAKRLPIIGHTLAWSSVPVDMALAKPGQEALAGRAATASVLGGYAVNIGATAATAGGLALLGFSAPAIVVGGAVVGIAAGLGYDFGGYDDQLKDLYKEYGESYYQEYFGN